jgi:hypothetical protein
MAGAVFLDEATIQRSGLPSRKQSEPVIYYRKMDKGPEQGWIVTADSQMHKQIMYLQRGWQPLPQYGLVGRASCHWDSAYRWYPILSHPEGPKEFPIEQILQFGWHRPGGLPSFPMPNGEPYTPTLEQVFFPQLADQDIDDFGCPECENRLFIKGAYLARHLADAHKWDYNAIISLGEQIGIDFRRDFAPMMKRSYTFPKQAQERAGGANVPQPRVNQVRIPSRDELVGGATMKAAIDADSRVEPERNAATVKTKRTQTPEQAAKSREALAKARLARETKKAAQMAAEQAPAGAVSPEAIERMAQEQG